MAPCTRIKMCGFTRPEDALSASRLGVDAIGLVFCENSPRFVTVSQAYEIEKAVLPFTTLVGVFVNPDEADVCSITNQVRLELLQFHGDEPPEFCRGFGRPYLKAFRVGEGEDKVSFAEKLGEFTQKYASAQGILLDTQSSTVQGGTGQAFDWDLLSSDSAGVGRNSIPMRIAPNEIEDIRCNTLTLLHPTQDLSKPLILAGGLTAENVAEAIRITQPYAVDVSSGIESAPGIKDAVLMQQFIENVRLCQTTV